MNGAYVYDAWVCESQRGVTFSPLIAGDVGRYADGRCAICAEVDSRCRWVQVADTGVKGTGVVVTVRVEVHHDCPHGFEGDCPEQGCDGGTSWPYGPTPRSFTEWPPEAIEAMTEAFAREIDPLVSDQRYMLPLMSREQTAALLIQRGMEKAAAAAWETLTGDNK